MAENKPINWAYPFPSKETNSNPLQLLTHMAKAKGGYYPTGENGLWHGGVHFDDGTAAVFDQSSVRCIADGEVIAYRIDERYPVSEFIDEVPRIKRASFSTGFVLAKHSLCPPPLDNAAGASSSEQSPPALTFYSLYMHLQDWAGYQDKPDLARPAFWAGDTYIVDTQGDELLVRSQPNRGGAELARLAKGTQVRIRTLDGEYCKLVAVLGATTNPALVAGEDEELPGYVAFKYLKAQKEPQTKDQVVILEQGIPIKAGELIGHLGTYQNHNSAAHPLVHLEVFSCDDVPGFIGRSRAWASRLPDSQKTLLKVYKGASKLIAHRDDIKADNPPKLSDSGSQIGVDLIIPQALLDGLPAASKIQVKTPVEGSGTPSTTYWWRLDGLFADENGNAIDGWLAEQELITTRHSPWEWLDFQCIEDTGTPLEKLAYTFNARGMLSADEQHNYRAQISKADGGPIVALARLYDIVDTDEDGVLTSKEIQAALAKPWHAQVLGQLITRYESEWFWNKAKWDELDLLLADENGQKSPAWEVEKQRIETLSWWKELAGKHGISGDGKAWYLQPLALTGVFSSATKVDPTIKEGQITFDAEGNNIPTSPFFSRVIHWPGNDLSGVTLGRGYDMGSRSESEIYNHMRNAGIEHDQATKIAQGYGKKGTTAQQFVRDNKTNIGEISTEQEIILFNTIYPDYVERAVKNYNHWTASEPDRTEWSALDQVIRDVLVDFVYQGFTKGPNPMKAGMRNDKEELIRYIENTPAISQYELGRNRARYLRSN
ncbi:pesticin C-terminus-like muramidase [Pseudomonas sp. Z8(2022)]|uniref:pesticin C-terminus-like muramidase n=1 Tax=Pseudomonas sp. Z8(2022) TaxID=2962597 RepID=UPI0021F401A9|nr:pesticin C-terminus-like muramidase [Pseudomonas sp. Z8(2022)]UYP30622.1 pesticin C-terminus-like muramidase [Pseudomonas sp. Z8(2022)]